ncbi:hypothetical protein A2U01_0040812 [Trifolium medium]|uniref:Uncharacterized protein n=1 Tax=Trifolium medium TaxID=97028 RepID=A0A392Q6W9_9FABA|nr:hypothetical protein [Trifolium medium]
MIRVFVVHLCFAQSQNGENDELNGAEVEDDEPNIVIDERNRGKEEDELHNRRTAEVALKQRPSRMTNEAGAARIGRTQVAIEAGETPGSQCGGDGEGAEYANRV